MVRSIVACLLLGFFVCEQSHSQNQNLRGEPVVVYQNKGAVPARSYWLPLLRGESGKARNSASFGKPQPKTPSSSRQSWGLPLEEKLPLRSDAIKPGMPRVYTQEDVQGPVFIVGMDPQSMNWLEAMMGTLVDIGASGMVVQADDLNSWLELREAAARAGVALQLFESEKLAELYPIDSYPALILSPELAARLKREEMP